VLAAAFVKGAIGVGFPTLGTPLLTLFLDVKVAVAVLVLPNIVMDAIQIRRRGRLLDTARRLWMLLACTMLGTVLGTRILVALSARAVTLILGGFVLAFVALNLTRFSPRVRPGWEPWLSPLVGLLAGLLGGVTNALGTPLIVYFYALAMDKHEFVRSVALTFLVAKLVQLGALGAYGLLGGPVLAGSLALTAAALGGFGVGLRVQDRVDQRTFNRFVLAFLAALGAWLLVRALR